MPSVIQLKSGKTETVFDLEDLLRLVEQHMGDETRRLLEELNAPEDDAAEYIADLEKDEELKSFMFMHVSMQIDFDNIVWYMNLLFNFKNRPIPEWPYNPWLREKVLEYRSSLSDADLHSQYDRYMDSHPVATWMDFMFQAALDHAVSKTPALLTPLEQMDIERDVREELWLTDVRVLGDLVQLTKEELNLLFDDNPSKISQIDRCLKKHGLHIYTSNLLTCKIPVISTKMSNFAVN